MATDPTKAFALLEEWLEARLAPESLSWYSERRSVETDRDFYLAIALVPRKLGKQDLNLTDSEREMARGICQDWDPSDWTIDQSARVALLLAGAAEAFDRRLSKLCATGDVGELVTLYQALPLYPNPEGLTSRAAEGLRSNVVAVFQAVAHKNPFPRDHFSDAAWNQMVLKALFIGSTLLPILGLDARANEALAATMIDYAHERWAAGRAVNPELWRCVGPFLNEERLSDLQRVWESDDRCERQAASLALAASALPEAKALLSTDEAMAKGVNSGEISWAEIHRSLTAR